MNFSVLLTKPRLRVFSAVCSNLTVFWLVTLLGARDPYILMGNFVYAVVSLYLAIRAEEIVEIL